MVLRHSLSLGALVAFFLYLNRFLQPIQLLVQQYNTYQQGQASVLKLRTLLETEPSVQESPTAERAPSDRQARSSSTMSPSATSRRCRCSSTSNLRIAAGETVAFVGPTGAGKSTMAKLVTRFYDPTAGRVLIDGHDLRSVTLSSLRRQLGVVPQEPFLFAGTIRDNIAFARPDASDAEVDEAVRAVGLVELIERLPRRHRARSSRNVVSRCPRASDSWSPWPGRSLPSRGCSCSTRRPRTWTCSPRPGSRRRSTSSSRRGRPC